MRVNEFNQPIGPALPNFTPGQQPAIDQLVGKYAVVEPLNFEQHLAQAYQFYGPSSPLEQWTYLPLDRFADLPSFSAYFKTMVASTDPYYLAIKNKATKQVVGTFALMNINPANRTVEMGWVLFGPQLKRSRVATEAQFLVMQYVFETLKYRRYEWECDHLNQPSRQAALRLGFQFEGTLRQKVVYNGRSRDTDWFGMTETDYATMKPKFERWLAADNFDEHGQQKRSLNEE